MSTQRPEPQDRVDPPAEGFDARWRKQPGDSNAEDPRNDWTPAELRELEQLTRLSDVEILRRAGTAGPALIGRPLAYLAAKVRISNPEGTFGPAILDHDFDAKDLAKRGLRRGEDGRIGPTDAPLNDRSDPDASTPGRTAEELDAASVPVDPTDLADPRNPWTYVTLSGAKTLAQAHQVSHKPRVKRNELIAQLQAAGVVPPPVPSAEDLKDAPDPADADERKRQQLARDLETANPGATQDTR